MAHDDRHLVAITTANPALEELALSWKTAVFSSEDGIGPLDSLYQAGDALVAVAKFEKDGMTILGSGVMVGPGILLTATHVLDVFSQKDGGPVFITFLATGARAWLPKDIVTVAGTSRFDESQRIVSDLSLVSCTLNSDAHADRPLMLAPMQIALPLIGERLWAIGFRHQGIESGAALVSPLISSGLVTGAYPGGRGERMASPCFEVNMETVGGMSGGAVVNADGLLVGIVSSSWEGGGPTYVTLIWEAIRLHVKGTVPDLMDLPRISLLGAKAKGLVKLEGNIDRDPFGNIKIALSAGEGELMMGSLSPEQQVETRRDALNREQLEAFMDTWGADMEDAANEAVMASLNQLSLPKLRAFLEGSGVSKERLDAIEAFSVEEFEGIEDLWVTANDETEYGNLHFQFYVDIRSLLWSLEVSGREFDAHEEDFRRGFYNVQREADRVTLDLIQRRYFMGSMVFDREAEAFADVLITASALRPPRQVRSRRVAN